MPPRCPRCDKVLSDTNLMALAAPRCVKCHSLLYVIVCAPVHLAFVVETTAVELHWLNHQQYTPAQVLEHFGATFG